MQQQPSNGRAEQEQSRARVTAWIDTIRARFRVEIPEIAKRAGVSASTIYRWYDGGHAFNASLTSLTKIGGAFDMALPGSEASAATGFAEGDAQQVYGEAARPLRGEGEHQGVWQLSTRALELAGYMPGDLLLVDVNVKPRAGDVVCAQVYNLERGTAETRIRIFEAPYLTTRTMDPASLDRPLYVDNERVHIAGVVVRSLRVRA